MSYKFALVDLNTKKLVVGDPIVSSMPADIHGYYYAIKTHDGKYMLVPDIPVLKKSAEYKVDAETNTTGVIIERTYSIIIPTPMKVIGRVLAIVKTSAYNTSAANTGDKYVVCFELYKGDTQLASTTSPEHVPNSTSEVSYLDLLTNDINTDFSGGESLGLKIVVKVTSVDADNPGIHVTLWTDPRNDDLALIFYLQVT